MSVRAACAAALLAASVVVVGCGETEARTAPPSASSPPITACGARGRPDCPLQRWMKANAQANLASGDAARLAEAMDALARAEPADSPGWAETARRAAAGARAGDLDAVRAQCRECHVTHRASYRATRRTAPPPGALRTAER